MDENPLLFWKTNVQFEHLKPVAKTVLTKSASSVAVECVFSTMGLILNGKRFIGLVAIRRMPFRLSVTTLPFSIGPYSTVIVIMRPLRCNPVLYSRWRFLQHNAKAYATRAHRRDMYVCHVITRSLTVASEVLWWTCLSVSVFVCLYVGPHAYLENHTR